MSEFIEELLGRACIVLLGDIDRGYEDWPNQIRNAAIEVAAKVRANRFLRAVGVEPKHASWRPS